MRRSDWQPCAATCRMILVRDDWPTGSRNALFASSFVFLGYSVIFIGTVQSA